MSDNIVPIKCPCCDHEFYIDLDDPHLDDYEFVVRMAKQRPPVTVKKYRFKCPECSCFVIVEIEVET